MIKKIAIAAALIGIIFYALTDLKPNTKALLSDLHKFRSDKNRAFRQSPDSPLSPEQKAGFDSLKYYPGELSFVINATISREAKPDTVLMQMSDNKAEKYLHWGQAKFQIEQQPQQLSVYLKANGTDSTLFIPFTDATNGHETYGGGRYLDAPIPKLNEGEIKLDFNRAYNPYCAYNNEFSCPVPPAENRLQVAIAAGEKSFHD
ncbi:MAG: hypothetical protein JWR44_1267 [Hymenobacter sp.]|jgi:uncharacterized protein (DUF1684 family)|nr:hypothetical protein [Hymenobacter sp.]